VIYLSISKEWNTSSISYCAMHCGLCADEVIDDHDQQVQDCRYVHMGKHICN
jgi:hypothetical protein